MHVSQMSAIELLQTRSSAPSRNLGAPGPSAAQLHDLLRLAMRVPDHGKLAPWRFVVVQNDARATVSELLVRVRTTKEPHVDADALDKDRQRFLHAPCIVIVVMCPVVPHKIPLIEQHLSAGAVCMQLLNAAHAMGFGAQWLTGWAAYDLDVARGLGLSDSESVAGFVHIGCVEVPAAAERPRPNVEAKLSFR